MNRSEEWTVKHEPGGPSDERSDVEVKRLVPVDIQERFNRENYGEVNSRLRWIVSKIAVGRNGIIIRDPVDIWVSTYKRKTNIFNYNKNQLIGEAKRLERSFRIFKHAEVDEIIPFWKMTNDVDYVQSLLQRFGIDDVNVTASDLETKKNASSKDSDVSAAFQGCFMKHVDQASKFAENT